MTRGAKDQVRRLLSLLPYLLAHPGVRVSDVAELFSVSEAQVLNDLSVLWFCGLPGLMPGDYIEIDMDAAEGEGVIHVSNADFLTRPQRLSTDEALGLLVALRVLRDSGGSGERGSVDRLIARLEEAAGQAGAGEGVPVAVQVDSHVDTGLLDTVRQAMADGRRLELEYWVPTRDETTVRRVDPMRLFTMDGNDYLEAWCHLAEDVRLFRLDRVASAVELDEPSAPPPEAVPRDLGAGLFRPAPDDPVAELELDPSAAWVAEYYPCEEVVDLGEGRQRVRMRVSDPRWLRRLGLRLGGHARVLSPAEYASDVRETASAALAAYG